MKSEKQVQTEIQLALSEYGIPIRMQSGNFQTEYGGRIKIGITGMSDILFIGQGFICWLEIKNEKGRPSKEQLNFIEQMKSYGHKAGVVRSVEEALRLIGVDK